jgi:hypothetical protein
MLLCPAIRLIVKVSAPLCPSLVNIVCRTECITKSGFPELVAEEPDDQAAVNSEAISE